MKTTLRELKEIEIFNFNKLTNHLGTDNLDTEVTVLQILEICGIKDAVYALKTQNYKDYCLFLADVAESVLYIFEKEYPDDQRPRKCIEGVRLWYNGKITDEELNELREDAWSAASTSAYVAARVADAAWAAYATARAAAYAAATVWSAVYAAYAAWSVAAYSADAMDKKWNEIEVILRKYI